MWDFLRGALAGAVIALIVRPVVKDLYQLYMWHRRHQRIMGAKW